MSDYNDDFTDDELDEISGLINPDAVRSLLREIKELKQRLRVEREACARIAEDAPRRNRGEGRWEMAGRIAAEIRGRKDTPAGRRRIVSRSGS